MKTMRFCGNNGQFDK